MLTLLWLGVLNNDAQLETTGTSEEQQTFRVVGDPTEGALLVAAAKAGTPYHEINEAYPRENEIPFDSERKRMITVHDIIEPKPEDFSPFYDKKHKDWDVIAVKGAPDVVLELCTRYQAMNDEVKPLDEKAKQRILDANDAMTADALRVLGLAYRVEKDVPNREVDSRRSGKGSGLCGPGRHDRSAAHGSETRARTGAPRGHPHGDDHRRLSQHGQRHCRIHWPAAARTQGGHRRRPGQA